MNKVKVQDATKELSANAGKTLEDFSRLKKQSQEMLSSLRKLTEGFARQEKERIEREAKEEQRKQSEANARFMNAYSSDQVPEIPATPVPAAPVEEKPAKVEEKKPEPVKAEPAKSEEKKPEPAKSEEKKPEPAKAEEKKPEPAKAEEKKPEEKKAEPAKPEQAQQQRQPQGQRPQQANGQRPYGRPVQPNGQQPQQANGQQANGQRPYGRPVQPNGQQPQQTNGQRPYGRPVQANGQQPQQGGQRPYGRPAQPGMQGGQRPYGRPVQPGEGKDDAPQGGQRYGQRPAGGAQGARPQGGARPGAPRSRGPELIPTEQKERVSNYDPNKKQYERQNNPERTPPQNKNARRKDMGPVMGEDEDFVRGKKKKKAVVPQKQAIEAIHIDHAVMTHETITVRDLTERIGKPAGEILKKLMLLGILANINQELDYDTANLVASEFGVELELKLAETAEDALEKEDVEDTDDDLQPRPPVVTIMGHVDHGKTSLLDYIRNTHVTKGEAGGITQHIGAYSAKINDRKITFLDTPGHEAFTSMRLRGAQATDIAVLVVAADDGVMPQTIEAINHAKIAEVQTIVAINKIDKPTANIDRIKQQLTEYGLITEEWGGDTIMVPVSAKTGEGVDELMENILLVADVQDYRANPNRKARGIIIEARLDKGRGPIATVLVKNGTLRVGDTIVAGTSYGRVRAMTNDRGENVKVAGPSDPVEVIGFNEVPSAGDTITAVDDEKLSRQVAEERRDKERMALIKSQQKTSLEDLFSQISAGQVKDLNIVIKADVQGSVEAVRQSLEKLTNEEVRVRCIHGAVGAINESDVMLANTANAIIIGFNVRPDSNARDMAEREKIDMRLYRVIYDAIEDVENAMKGMLAPKFKETLLGHATVRQTFRVSGVGTIAGSYVLDGKIARNAQIRLLRDNVVIHEGKIDSLKRFKDDAKEVATGYECGIGIEGYNDIKENDVIECFIMEKIEP